MRTCDVGSLPSIIQDDLLRKGAQDVLSPRRARSGPAGEFRRAVLTAMRDKLAAGIDVPTYPQFRDMNEMFLAMFSGIERFEGRYVEVAKLAVKEARIPEVLVLREHAAELAQELGLEKVRLRMCITGPHTLSFQFAFRSAGLLRRLGHVLAEVVKANLASGRHFEITVVTLDEPTFATVDDLLLERGSEGREALLSAWEEVLSAARSKGVLTCLHLHSTADDLFWHAEALRLVESHVEDPLYRLEETKRLLEEHDKALVATICRTDFDALVIARARAELPRGSEAEVAEKVGELWKAIRLGSLDPVEFLEPVELLARRLKEILTRFGPDKVLLAGPECGLRAFPTYGAAIECLKRVAEACRMVET